MELKWLEDYLALAKYRNFSEAAKARHLTQPAFSRRIRLLETWVDVVLINRDVSPVRLTSAGQDFLPKAEKLVDDIYKIKEETQQFTQGRKTITVHTQHSLMVSHVPNLLEGIQPLLANCFVRFTANNQQDAVQKFLSNDSDFLLCFVALGLPQRLNSSHLEEIVVSHDRLLPVIATDKSGKPFIVLFMLFCGTHFGLAEEHNILEKTRKNGETNINHENSQSITWHFFITYFSFSLMG